ncbi:hypothetical protein ASA1KI_08900 [Opitutales bacterium ASA1]|nr:hypothetical protein ASA1KI_08900 [Opitutales bacterium ASA1]
MKWYRRRGLYFYVGIAFIGVWCAITGVMGKGGIFLDPILARCLGVAIAGIAIKEIVGIVRNDKDV